MNISAYILVVIFLLIALLHLYWAVGGKWGVAGTLPKTDEGDDLFTPGPFSTLVVAIGLLGFSGYYMNQAGVISIDFIAQWSHIIGWVIPTIFLIRAIGDFNYCGFFKRKKNSKFAELDTKFFSPLCLLLATLGYIVITTI